MQEAGRRAQDQHSHGCRAFCAVEAYASDDQSARAWRMVCRQLACLLQQHKPLLEGVLLGCCLPRLVATQLALCRTANELTWPPLCCVARNGSMCLYEREGGVRPSARQSK